MILLNISLILFNYTTRIKNNILQNETLMIGNRKHG